MRPVLPLLPLVIACTDVTAPSRDPTQLTLEFAMTGTSRPGTVESLVAIKPGAQSQITIDGWFITPSGGYTLTAVLDRTPESYVLRVSGHQTSIGLDVMSWYRYHAIISELPVGRYRFEVWYDHPGSPVRASSQVVRVR